MVRLEIVLVSLALLGLLLKVLHLPFAGLLFVASLSVLILMYFLLPWLLFPRPSRHDQVLGLSLFCGLAFTITMEGLLFKVQMWPMATFLNQLGLLLTGIALALILAMRGGRNGLADYFNGLTRRALPLLMIGALLFPVRETDILRFHHRNDPWAGELLDSLENTTDPSLRRALHERLLRPREEGDGNVVAP